MMLWLLSGCAGPPAGSIAWVPPGEPGPYAAGATTLLWTDARGKDLVAEVWYPASPAPWDQPDAYDPLTLALQAYRDAPAIQGAWPVVGFTHGFLSTRVQSAFLAEHLASHGYVVVAPDHAGNTLFDFDPDRTPQMMAERPGDLVAALDRVFAWEPALDAGAVAVMGHSLGAFTALTVGGGRVDVDGVLDRCAAGEADDTVCGLIDTIDPGEIEAGAVADPRVRVTVALSPGLWYGFGPDGAGLESVEGPVLVAGDRDTVLDYTTEAVPTFEHLSGPRRMITLVGTGHYAAFSDICLLLPGFSDDCLDAPMDPARGQALTRTVVTAALDVGLRGLEQSAPFLEWEGLGSPDDVMVHVEP